MAAKEPESVKKPQTAEGGGDSHTELRESPSERKPEAGGRKVDDVVDPEVVFLRNRLYPEPGPAFTFHRKPLDEVKDECVVVVDTCELLLPYKVGSRRLPDIDSSC